MVLKFLEAASGSGLWYYAHWLIVSHEQMLSFTFLSGMCETLISSEFTLDNSKYGYCLAKLALVQLLQLLTLLDVIAIKKNLYVQK